jgi:hypothetical protein
MENSVTVEQKPNRVMWFSMWFLEAIASFGLAFFPMFYYSIERRNLHFKKQQEFERKIAAFHRKDWNPNNAPERNAKLWAASIILIVPVFAIVYFLSKDFLVHEMHQQEFFRAVYPELEYMPQSISIRNYALITLATLGIGVVYWLYKIVNIYNNHFKEQHHIEYEILRLMEAKSHIESV